MVYTLRFFPLQNAVCFIILTCLVPVLFTFYIQDLLKLKKNNSGSKRLRPRTGRITPGKETQRPLYRGLGVVQGRSKQVQKSLPPTGFDPADCPARNESIYRLRPHGPQMHPRHAKIANANFAVSNTETLKIKVRSVCNEPQLIYWTDTTCPVVHCEINNGRFNFFILLP